MPRWPDTLDVIVIKQAIVIRSLRRPEYVGKVPDNARHHRFLSFGETRMAVIACGDNCDQAVDIVPGHLVYVEQGTLAARLPLSPSLAMVR